MTLNPSTTTITAPSLNAVPECCSARETTRRHRIRTCNRSLLEPIQWLLSAIIVLLMPKCPICLAAYIALGTGIGLNLATATYLRTGLLIAAGLSLTYLTLRIIARWRQRSPGRLPC